MGTTLYNLKALKNKRQTLRNNLTSAEAALWLSLKNKQLEGKKFRRQFSIGRYILDFYCPREKLAVELDGAHHYTEEGIKYDVKRDAYLTKIGIKIIRIENKKVFEIHEQVLEYIKSNFKTL